MLPSGMILVQVRRLAVGHVTVTSVINFPVVANNSRDGKQGAIALMQDGAL